MVLLGGASTARANGTDGVCDSKNKVLCPVLAYSLFSTAGPDVKNCKETAASRVDCQARTINSPLSFFQRCIGGFPIEFSFLVATSPVSPLLSLFSFSCLLIKAVDLA